MGHVSRRGFLRTTLAATAATAVAPVRSAASADADLDLAAMLKPVPRLAVFRLPEHYVWCGTMARGDDGVCHLYFSRWPKSHGHQGWVTHSEVGHATADNPLGPYRFKGMALQGSGGDNWDAHVIHNPTVCRFGSKYYLYYTGNRGDAAWRADPEIKPVRHDATWWLHRNNQRVGVAVADDPNGPWQRFDKPLYDVSPQSWDQLIISNPSVTQMPDGRFLLMYKTVTEGKRPFGGRVLHGVAFADNPLGPFKKHPEPILDRPGVKFALEDPYVWSQDGKLYAIIKDQGGYFTGIPGMTLALFESREGTDWRPARHTLVSKLEIRWADGEVQPVRHLERPQLYVEDGRPRVLFCASDLDQDRGSSFNVHIPLG